MLGSARSTALQSLLPAPRGVPFAQERKYEVTAGSTRTFMLATGLAVVIAWKRDSLAQKPTASDGSRADSRSTVARAADGHPDLEGVWNFATLTPLQRPDRFAGRAFMTDEEAAAFERDTLQGVNADRRGATGPPLVDVPRTTNSGSSVDRSQQLEDESRHPWLSILPTGRIPALTADAQRRQAQRAASGHRFDRPAETFLCPSGVYAALQGPLGDLPTAPDGANLSKDCSDARPGGPGAGKIS